MSKKRTEVKAVYRVMTLKCEYQIDNTLEEPHVLKCMGVTVSGNSNSQALSRLQDELNMWVN